MRQLPQQARRFLLWLCGPARPAAEREHDTDLWRYIVFM